jgi:hypothetical protein
MINKISVPTDRERLLPALCASEGGGEVNAVETGKHVGRVTDDHVEFLDADPHEGVSRDCRIPGEMSTGSLILTCQHL